MATERTFEFEHADGIGFDVAGMRIDGGFAGRFTVEFDVDFPPEITGIHITTASGEIEASELGWKMGLGRDALPKMIAPQLYRVCARQIDEANAEICAGRAAREERSQRAYHQWQSL